MTQLFLLPLTEAAKLSGSVTRRFPCRAARAARMRDPDDRLRCIGAGALLDYVLKIDEEKIHTNEYGKPFIEQQNKQFNLSHSGSCIVLAVSDSAVGVDVQRVGPARGKVAQRCFTEEEQLWCQKEETRFFTIWTLKESVAKAVGMGLRLTLNSFSVLPLLNGNSITAEHLMLFGQALSLPGHALAVCSAEPFAALINPNVITAAEIERSE